MLYNIEYLKIYETAGFLSEAYLSDVNDVGDYNLNCLFVDFENEEFEDISSNCNYILRIAEL